MLRSETPLTLDREALRLRYLANRNRSAELFGLVHPAAYYDRPIALRYPIVFYEGHLPGFSFNKLVREALGGPSLDPAFERLFERGIDPADLSDAARHERGSWPERARVSEFAAACDAGFSRRSATGNLTDAAASPMLERGQAAFTILEHEEMHHETLLYMLHRLPYDRKATRGRGGAYVEREPLASGRVAIPAGRATLGVRRDAIEFGWDNEFDEHAVDVARVRDRRERRDQRRVAGVRSRRAVRCRRSGSNATASSGCWECSRRCRCR